MTSRRLPAGAWALLALTAIAFLLRAGQLHQSLLGDEVFTYEDIFGHSFGTVLTTVHTGGENSPPLFFLLAWAAAKLGDPSTLIRLPSLLLGTATVPVVYLIARETVGRVAGLIGATVMALAPFAVYYGIEARPYATMTFFVALSTLALLRAVRTRSTGWWVLYSLSATAAAYSHYTCVFVLAVQAAWAIWSCRARPSRALIANAAIVVLYAPWLPRLRGKELAVIGQIYPLGVHRVLTDLLRPIPGHPAAPLSAIPTIPGLLAIAAFLIAGGALLVRGARGSAGDHWAQRLPTGLPLLIALTIATPIGLLAYSLLVTDLWLPRGLSASMPAAALVVGALLAALPPRVAGAGTAVLVVTLFLGTLRSFGADYNRGPYRAIAQYLDRIARPSDPISIAVFQGPPAFRAMFKHPHRLVGSIAALWTTTPPGRDAFLVLDDAIARAKRIGTPQHPGFQLISRRHYQGGLATDVLTYQRRS